MKKLLLICVFVLVLMSFASASVISISEVDSTTIIEPGEIGEYNLRITNVQNQELQVQIKGDPYVGLPSSDFEYIMVDPDIVTVKGYGSTDVNIKIKLKEDVITQTRYKTYVTATVLNVEGEEEEYNLQVFAKEPEKKLSMYVKEYAESISPGNDYMVVLALENNVPETLSNVNVYVSSELFEEHETIQLFDDQERDVEYSFPIDSTTEPGNYELSVRVFYDDELQGSEEIDFIVELNTDISETVEDIDKFLYRDVTVTKINNGNYVIGENYDFELGGVERWFARYSLRPTYTDDFGSHWSFNLEPGESYSVNIKVDYRPLVVAIIVILVFGLLMWYWMSKGVIIKKEVFKLKQTSEGISDFKILLHIKNNTNKPVKNLMLIEMLPRVINPLPRFGTLKPNNVQRGDKGVRMIWRIQELSRGEERIISYDVEAKMKIIGQFMLPQAIVKYRTHRGKVVTSKSNRLSVVSGFLSESKKKKR
ncbi:hypothetical protein HOD38_02115 [archaeon]|jgi:hypothetical protein|nr:hypothetical protein [archaeon]MBT4397038.1 hypothetical protein [archaeon]MBT4441029.1 hypothetical protein [archaeon]